MFAKALKISILYCFLIATAQMFSQGSRCSDIQPFCAGDGELVFANSNSFVTNVIVAEDGPFYGCLELPKYPSWFYLQIENDGDLEFLISQFENEDGSGDPLDVDFAVWGPFNKMDSYCSPAILSEENLVDCSYEEDAVERASISNAKSDEIYVFLILNFDGRPGFISLQQINDGANAGSTDCTILDGVLGGDQVLCGESEYKLIAEVEGVTDYSWYKLNDSSGEFEIIQGESDANLVVSASGIYKVFIENASGNNNIEDQVEIEFYDPPKISAQNLQIPVCQQNSSIDITQLEQEILNGNSFKEGYEIEYYESLADIEDNDRIRSPENYEVGETETIFVRVQDLFTGCYSEVEEIKLELLNLPQQLFSSPFIACVDAQGKFLEVMHIGEDLGKRFQYTWYNNGEIVSQDYDLLLDHEVENPEYELVVTDATTGCEVSFVASLEYVSQPETVEINVLKGDFGDHWTVEVLAHNYEGHNSQFEYSLDGENYVDTNVFKNVPKGMHRISVRELNECGEAVFVDFTVIGYDYFFTPNGDGFNDHWTVSKDPTYKVLNIKLFDRYGNYLRSIDPEGNGWDGIVNGKLLSEDDYWFRLEYINPSNNSKSQFSSHFTLIR